MWLKIANHNQDKPNKRRSQLGTAKRLFELSYYLLITARCDWSTIFASCFPRVLTSVKNQIRTIRNSTVAINDQWLLLQPELLWLLIVNALQLNELSALRNTFYPEYKYSFLFLYVFHCFSMCSSVFSCFSTFSHLSLCGPIFSSVSLSFPLFSPVFLCFQMFSYVFPIFLCFTLFSYVFLCFSMFSPVSLCFHLFPYSCFPLFSRVSLCFLCFPIFSPIVGFHMTSLKFKLQNYRSYWDFTFMVY